MTEKNCSSRQWPQNPFYISNAHKSNVYANDITDPDIVGLCIESLGIREK